MNFLLGTAAATLAAAIAAPGWAAGPPATQAETNYQQERARCLAGQSNQAQETCLKEAGAAQDETRRGSLGGASAADLERNATQRCEAQPPADRAACIQRTLGGSTDGSVGGGGVIRQTETPVK
ncbi:hypothetical protein WG902_04480 [Ramlibacter sp. PS3R-8]|uniref:hypothetical protein n=1 Tax=Ramlibacter sp. PS3R-8 TaxID=3133437 RepID=UPI00309B67BB